MSEEKQLLEKWFKLYADRVFSYLLHRTDPQTAQDLVQDVFILAFRKLEHIPEPPLGWLFAAARRLLANKTRGFRRRDMLLARISEAAAETADRDHADIMLTFASLLKPLSAQDREILTLTAWYGLTASEGAMALGCSVSAYTVRLHRARKKLIGELSRKGSLGGSPAQHLQEALRDH
ncbi:RNA polymerase sigma factor [Nakamurella antarctica]|nr:RNA polymerase sigma factor [Nakamurella antarctica]